ncbi:MAG: hypothetical protein M3454_14380, partial [Actinomycetota bacterium]|nr:hypothetical protein [Actinomycetota bacterium]
MSDFVVEGTVTSTRRTGDTSTAGYGVDASMFRRVAVGEGTPPTSITIPAAGTARVDTSGSFRLAVGGEGDPVGPLELVVSAPDGTRVASRSLTLDKAAKVQRLRVATVERRTITAADDPALGVRAVLSGRVVDIQGRAVPAHLPVIIWGVPHGAAAGVEPVPVVITETQTGGYFSVPWPADQLERAEGRVTGRGPALIPLDDGHRLPLTVLLVLDLEGVEGVDDDCHCDDAPPRAPEPADLTSNPAAFSQDLGTGCVDLTTPNRTIEEFAYRFVVRTSEPKVKGLTLGVRRTVPPGLLGDLLGVAVVSDVLRARAATTPLADGPPLALDVITARHLVRSDRPPTVDSVARAAWL